jgi:uroporphyrin-III C-methyltransferase/precorrin-2 dehydrogenase/sirohydrochlorin ferrochelatase
VAVVCDGSMPGERTVLTTLVEVGADVDRHAVLPPAIIVIGEVVAVAHPERFAGRAESRP